ncbi:BatA domain-containing protein [Sphingomonadaceae bacterium OTU29THOMA1]|nr:BatA domain-containing protein [Sphingomonadaceae bacterium OTU29THOMA1]
MTLLLPLGLAAFASVLLPLLIHLARRTEQRPTDFAALRWLRQKPRPRHRPRFDERLLLVTRLLLLVAVALVLAQPVLSDVDAAMPVIAVAPGADIPPPSAARRIWLAPGFPAVDTPPPTGRQPIASLIRQLDAELPPKTRLTIVVPRLFDGADAERPTLSRTVTWRIAGDGRGSAAAVPAAPPALRYDPAHPGARYLAAAIRALGGTDIGYRSVAVQGGAAGRALIWLGAGPIPRSIIDHIEAGETILVSPDAIFSAGATVPVWRDAMGAPLVDMQPLGKGRLLRFTRALSPAAMPQLLDPDFPHRLAALFARPPEPARVAAEAYAPRAGGLAPTPPARPLWPWLAVTVAALFVIERWLATRAGRAPVP